MSAGGWLVVTDRAGRAVKHFPLESGSATLGSAAACDVRLMRPAVSAHHATVTVHANQAMVRSVSERETLVNGAPVSVAALRHGDVIELGGRALRWEYRLPALRRPLAPQPALHRRVARARAPRRGSEPPPRDPIVLEHRASMPASATTRGKQVAVVQPQRRDGGAHADTPRSPSANRTRTSRVNASAAGSPDGAPQPAQITIRVYADGVESVTRSPMRASNGPRRGPSHSSGGRRAQNTRDVSNGRGNALDDTGEGNDAWDAHERCPECNFTRAERLWVALPQDDNCEYCGNGNATWNESAAESAPRAQAGDARHATADAADFAERTVTSAAANPRRSAQHLTDPTKATLWIESRKRSPRKSAAGRTTKTPVKTPKATPTKTPVKTPKATPVKTPKVTPVKTPAKASSVTPVVTRSVTPVKPARSSARQAVSARKRTPLRLVVLRKAHSAHRPRVTKIQAPLKMDSTKQAAILLMTRHTPKSKPSSLPVKMSKSSSPVVKKSKSSSPLVKKSKSSSPLVKKSKRSSVGPTLVVKKGRTGGRTRASTAANSPHDASIISQNSSASVIEITDSESQVSLRMRDSGVSRYSGRSSLGSPRLERSSQRSSGRRTGSRAFDGSDLDKSPNNRSSRVDVTNDPGNNSNADDSEAELTLRYSDSSITPSPRKPIHSRGSRQLEDVTALTTSSPKPKKSRSSIMIQVYRNSANDTNVSTYSLRTSGRFTDSSYSSTVASARRTRTLSPRAARSNLESYSIVDLVSDSNDSIGSKSASVYNSADSLTSASFDTPEHTGRRTATRGTVHSLVTSVDFATPDSKKPRSSTRARAQKERLTYRISVAKDANTSTTTPENTEEVARNISLNSTRISRASKRRLQISNHSDILNVDGAEDESPKTSKRISERGRGTPRTGNDVSANETLTATPAINRGEYTPENRHSPKEASTPVLNIQSLLDASQNGSPKYGTRRKSKRKTIGALRSASQRGQTGFKSKSLNLQRSVRGRDISANFDVSYESLQNEGEDVVTPKSAAKPVPEGVKNKHSSAKKPLSKRSLIDNLNESDIVKQLFNSPVKRKLSQSMTEFSRRHLLDEEETRRPTRATIAAAGISADGSLPNNSVLFTPGTFVSPLSNTRGSPNISGINRLFRKITPENDLRNVRGVKNLLRTPRARVSFMNNLSNVSGVKAVFAKSPRNRLSDVRVKEVFAAEPNNDLRKVSGVKELFQSQRKTRRSPKNALEDFRGVRNLFQEDSPTNDLRDVSGVKRTLRRTSPRNDLTDVRGVKQMFGRGKPRDDLNDVSGVERLFNESANYDSTFDQLLGRPPIKAVYTKSKSFSATSKVQKRSKKEMMKKRSLRDSISLINENVEEWLQKELSDRLHRNTTAEVSISKGNKSLNKSKNSSKLSLSRELQKLNTDTVEGSAPVVSNRTRNSSIIKLQSDTTTRKKSASELYGAHTLPIKKRSFVEASINRSSNDRSHKLPIKKRAVVHSTPVKGSVNLTMNASEIVRMSPISSEDKTADIDAPIRFQSRASPSYQQSPLKEKSVKKSIKDKSVEIAKISPKKTRSTKVAQNSPAVVKTRKGRKTKNENQEVPNVKKRRSSIVITKKAPGLSPKPPKPKSPRVTRRGKTSQPARPDTPKTSPKKTRSTRGQKSQASGDVKAETPKKNIRVKTRRTSLVVMKPSPKINPRATSTRRGKVTESPTGAQPQAKRTRKITITEPESEDRKKKSPRETQVAVQPRRQTRKTAVSEPAVDKTIAERSLPAAQARRTRRAAADTAQAELSTKKTNAQSKTTRTNARGKAEEPTSAASKTIEAQASVESTTRRGRRTKPDDTVPEATTTKKRKTAAEPSPKPAAKGRRAKAEVSQAQPTRARKARAVATEDQKLAEDLPTGRGRKRKSAEQEDKTEDNVEKKTTRRTRAAAKEEVAQPRGGGKAKQKSSVAAGAAPDLQAKSGKTTLKNKPAKGNKAAGGAPPRRNKRTNVDVSDAKESKEPAKRPRRGAPAPPAPPAPAPARRAATRR